MALLLGRQTCSLCQPLSRFFEQQIVTPRCAVTPSEDRTRHTIPIVGARLSGPSHHQAGVAGARRPRPRTPVRILSDAGPAGHLTDRPVGQILVRGLGRMQDEVESHAGQGQTSARRQGNEQPRHDRFALTSAPACELKRFERPRPTPAMDGLYATRESIGPSLAEAH